MIGNAAAGFMPSALTSTMHGAYSPIPAVISAPSTKLHATPTRSLPGESPSASPPFGRSDPAEAAMRVAATRSATPMIVRTVLRGNRATRPAPSHAPAADAAMSETSVVGSTSTNAM